MRPGPRPPWRRRGWAPKGQRLPVKAAFGHWNTMTFLAALRRDRVAAPWLRDGPINGALFQTYVEPVLVPTLARGDVVIMDNPGSHKEGRALRHPPRRRQASLPAKILPGLEPIEQLFAKLQHHLRQAQARSQDAVYHAIAKVLETVTAPECSNCFAHARYEPT